MNAIRLTLAKDLRSARALAASPAAVTKYASEKQRDYAQAVREKTIRGMGGWGGLPKRDRRVLIALARGLAAACTSADAILGENFSDGVVRKADAMRDRISLRKAKFQLVRRSDGSYIRDATLEEMLMSEKSTRRTRINGVARGIIYVDGTECYAI